MKKHLPILSLILLLAIGCEDPPPPEDYAEALLGVVWIVDSVQTPDTTIVGGYANLQFGNDMKFWGIGGNFQENRGSYEITGPNSLAIILTEQAHAPCDLSIMSCAFVKALVIATHYVATDSSLRLSDGDGNIVTFHRSLIEEDILNHTWKLAALRTPETFVTWANDSLLMVVEEGDTTTVQIFDLDVLIFEFGQELSVTGFLMCNTYKTFYEISAKGEIMIFPGGGTAAACGGGVRYSVEEILKSALLNANNYDITGNQLTFTSPDSAYSIVLNSD